MTTLQSVDSGSKIGAYTGPESGTAQDDNIKAALDIVIAEVATVTATTDFTAGTDDMFLVAGGAIEVISLFGQCTTLAGGSPGTMVIEMDATAGAAYDSDFSTTVNVDALGEGDIIKFSNATDEGVLSIAANTAAGQQLSWFAPEGTIEQTLSSTGTGVVKWYLTYRLLDSGATVTAA